MIKRSFLILTTTAALFYAVTAPTLAADSKFETSYKTTYDVAETGVTTVTSEIILKNRTADYFAEKYSLTTSFRSIYDVAAYDRFGNCQVTITGPRVDVIFNDKVVGAGNTLRWTLVYKTEDVAKKKGLIWEISLPKINTAENAGSYINVLKIPKSFGRGVGLNNLEVGRSEEAEKIAYLLSSDLIQKEGALISFGEYQLLNFTLKYHLKNLNFVPMFQEVTLPAAIDNTQEIAITKIDRGPQVVREDPDQNTKAKYFLWPKEEKIITVSGVAKVYNHEATTVEGKSQAIPGNLKSLLAPQPFWEVNDPSVKQIVAGLKDQNKTNLENARTIYDYVVSTLSYNHQKGFDNRLGAAAVLKDPTNSVCGEFADLFVTLARSSGLPARELEGYVLPDDENRPVASDVLHAWAQFYDPAVGWIGVDPTWGNTAQTDYFSHLDPNRIVLAIHGQSSSAPPPAGAYKLDTNEKDQVVVTFGTEYPNESGQVEIQKPKNLLDKVVQLVASVV